MSALKWLSLTGLVLINCSYATAEVTFFWQGYEWEVKEGESLGPGPNTWDSDNVWVDDQDMLHLKIALRDGQWTCAEVKTTERLGFGTYQWQTIGRQDQFDLNIVLGLFVYPDGGVDGTNEIDIEFSHFGDPNRPVGNFTVWPAKPFPFLNPTTYIFPVELNGTHTTHRFNWQKRSVAFGSYHGHTDGTSNPIAEWTFARKPAALFIASEPMPVHMNLWLFGGNPPVNGQEVEMIVSSFKFTALDAAVSRAGSVRLK